MRALIVRTLIAGLSVGGVIGSGLVLPAAAAEVPGPEIVLEQASVGGQVRLTASVSKDLAGDGLPTVIVGGDGSVVATCVDVVDCVADVPRPGEGEPPAAYQARHGDAFSVPVALAAEPAALSGVGRRAPDLAHRAAFSGPELAVASSSSNPVTDVSVAAQNGWTVTIGRRYEPWWASPGPNDSTSLEHVFVATASRVSGSVGDAVLEIVDDTTGYVLRSCEIAIEEDCSTQFWYWYDGPQHPVSARVVTGYDPGPAVVEAQVQYAGWYDRHVSVFFNVVTPYPEGAPLNMYAEAYSFTQDSEPVVPLADGLYALYIQDVTTGQIVAECSSTPCRVDEDFDPGVAHTFRGLIADPSDPALHVAAATTGVEVSHEEWFVMGPWPMGPVQGLSMPVGAYASPDVALTNDNYFLYIVDWTAGQVVKRCASLDQGWCYTTLTPAAGHIYAAVIAGPDGPVDGIRAISFQAFYPDPGGPMDLIPLPGGGSRTETSGGSNPSESCVQVCVADPINTVTGEYWDTLTDLELGRDVGVVRSYGSSLASLAGPFGYGWSWNWGANLQMGPDSTGSTLGDASQVAVVQENGSFVMFTEYDGQFIAPNRVKAELVEESDGTFTFTRNDGTTMSFTASGRLLSVSDRNANRVEATYAGGVVVALSNSDGRTVTVDWSGGRIVRLSDNAGREVEFTYDGGDLASVTAPDGSVRGYEYDASHRVTAIIDERGGRVTNDYDSQGRVIEQTDQLGRVTTLAYTGDRSDGTTTTTDPTGTSTLTTYLQAAVTKQVQAVGTGSESTTTFAYVDGRLVLVTDPLGHTSGFTYDEAGNRTSSTDALGRTTSSTYDSMNNPITQTAADGAVTSLTYDAHGNLLERTGPGPAVTTFTVNPDGTVATATDPLGHTTTFTYDTAGNLVTSTGPDGSVTKAAYDAAGNLTSSSDPRQVGAVAGAFTTTYTYDEVGRVRTVSDPLGAITAYDLDAAGNVVEIEDPTGAVTTAEYDLAGQMIASVDAEEGQTEYTYDDAGRIETLTTPTGATTTYGYDAVGNLTSVTDPLDRVTTTEYDKAGRATATVTPSGARTTRTFDAAGQVTGVIDPEGGQTVTTYDEAGRVATVTDGDGRTVTSTYDAAGRLVELERGDGSTMAWEYDAAGHVLEATNADGETTTYDYDSAGRLISRTTPVGTTTLQYDAAGNVTKQTATDGTVTHMTVDAANRVTGVDFPTGTPDVTYVYDLAGRLVTTTDQTGTSARSYNDNGQVTSETRAGASVGYEWDADGRLVKLTYPGGEHTAYDYDAAGQIVQVADDDAGTFDYDWTDDGQVAAIAYPNGVTTDLAYDDAGQLTNSAVAGAAGDLLALAYGYTDSGLLDEQTVTRSTSQTSVYDWDDRGALVGVAGYQAGTVTLTPGGKVAALEDGTTLAYGTPGTLATTTRNAVSTTYGYDGRGNRAAAGADTFGWDSADRLTSANVDSQGWTYTYFADGLRATASHGSTTDSFSWDTSSSVPLLLTDGDHRYVYGAANAPLAQVDGTGASEYLHGDLTGNIRTVTGETGDVLAESDYSAYGTPVPTGVPAVATVTAFGYAGEYTDPTGLVYLRARYYDPATAQFLSVDALVNVTALAYGYTDGNPLQYVDPLGLYWLQTLANVVAGFGDSITFGGTKAIRALIYYETDLEDGVEYDGAGYAGGSLAGVAAAAIVFLPATGSAAAIYATSASVGGVNDAVYRALSGDCAGAAIALLSALPGIGTASSTIAKKLAQALSESSGTPLVRSGTWWSGLGAVSDLGGTFWSTPVDFGLVFYDGSGGA